MSDRIFSPGGKRPGDPLTAADRNARNAAILRGARMSGSGGVGVREGSSGRSLVLTTQETAYVKLTTTANGDGGYGAKEVVATPLGTWIDAGRTMPQSGDPVYERNHNVSLTSGSTVYLATRAITTGEWIFKAAACSATVNAGPITCNGTLTGVTFDLRDSADTTTLATQTGSTASFTGLDGTLSYRVRASKAGYHTKTSASVTPGCGGTSSASVSTWPTTISWKLRYYMGTVLQTGGECYRSGISVAVTGDGTGSGTTDSSGNVTLSVTTSSASYLQDYTVTGTPPSGTGMDVKVSTFTGAGKIDACNPPFASPTQVYMPPKSGHTLVVCNRKYMPDTLTWTDDYGSCSIANSGTEWIGSYTYTSSHCIQDDLCAGLPDCFFDRTASVTVDVKFYMYDIFGGGSTCDLSTIGIERTVALGVAKPALFCNALLIEKYQPLDDAADITGYCRAPVFAPISGGAAETTVACSSSLAMNFAVAASSWAIVSGGPAVTFEETAVTVDVTGTIT